MPQVHPTPSLYGRFWRLCEAALPHTNLQVLPVCSTNLPNGHESGGGLAAKQSQGSPHDTHVGKGGGLAPCSLMSAPKPATSEGEPRAGTGWGRLVQSPMLVGKSAHILSFPTPPSFPLSLRSELDLAGPHTYANSLLSPFSSSASPSSSSSSFDSPSSSSSCCYFFFFFLYLPVFFILLFFFSSCSFSSSYSFLFLFLLLFSSSFSSASPSSSLSSLPPPYGVTFFFPSFFMKAAALPGDQFPICLCPQISAPFLPRLVWAGSSLG